MDGGTWKPTFDDYIFDSFFLGAALATSLALLAQFGQHIRPHALDDSRQNWCSWVEQPGVHEPGIIEVYPTFYHGILGNAKISPNWCHGKSSMYSSRVSSPSCRCLDTYSLECSMTECQVIDQVQGLDKRKNKVVAGYG